MDGEKLIYGDLGLKNDAGDVLKRHVQWVFMQSENRVSDEESNGSIDEDSIFSSDIEEDDDATSSSTSTSSISGPLYELSELMDHLPIKYVLKSYVLIKYALVKKAREILSDREATVYSLFCYACMRRLIVCFVF